MWPHGAPMCLLSRFGQEVLQKLNGQRCLESVPSLVAQMHGGARDLLHTLAARDARQDPTQSYVEGD